MKQCPVCKTTYTDPTLSFCLEDGAALTSPATEAPTQQFQGGTSPIRVNIAQDTSPTIVAPPKIQPPAPEKKGGSGLIIGLLAALLLLVVVGSGLVIGWLLLKDNGKPEVVSNKTPNQPPVNLSNTTDEANKLKDKIANLEKQVQQQKNARDSVPTVSNTTPQSTKITARVNSPNDGFLALRTAPSAEDGERILQIPHGATVTVLACLPAAKGKKGRWCRVDYDGSSGWAFDGFLVY
ncbi:MAG: SH3 domain-containing protein [Pyrinomonadaceae bacterium]|nr:SH3 domain-containing protein [Pyrinomonadaceae bacterium]